MHSAMATGQRGAAILSGFYNALWRPTLPIALLACAFRDAEARRERLGRAGLISSPNGVARTIWIHAASVGEIEAVRPVALGLAREIENLNFIVTTMTPAGRDAARRRVAGSSQLAPFDHPSTVRAFFQRMRPAMLLVAETELWPNFFVQSSKAGVPIAIINGRLSERSLHSYRLVRPLISWMLRLTDRILVQTADDARRFAELGASQERLFVTGNTKFGRDAEASPLRQPLTDFARDRPILIAGSTAPGEEACVLKVYRSLTSYFPELALILAPRHLDRVDEVERLLRGAAIPYVKASQMSEVTGPHGETPQVLLLDTMGELRGLYKRATIAFVGGSLAPGRGGQSLAEPANEALPVLFGPYHENQKEVAEKLIAAGAGQIVHDAAELEAACVGWLKNPASRIAAGRAARDVMERLAGGAAETIRHLTALLAA